MKFNKKPLSVSEQLLLLESRGLIVTNRSRAEHYLKNIGYYRLSSYALPFQVKSDPNHSFTPNISFDDILRLYVFDRELRLLVFDKVEKIEIAFRSAIVNQMSNNYGSHWYTDKSLFKSSFNHYELISRINDAVRGAKETFIKHYTTKYSDPVLPPSWMTFELLSCGQIFNIFKVLPNDDRREIANNYNLHPTVFESWFLNINTLRNTCAHHSRLWNRELGVKPKFPFDSKFVDIPFGNNRIYSLLFLIKYLSNIINPSSNFKNQLKDLLTKAPFPPYISMGFPNDWEKDKVWNTPLKKY